MSSIGIYGGTFDPIHYGHLILAREALEELDLAQVIFIPAAQSPHKVDVCSTPAEVRLEMLQIALAGEPAFAIDERELQRPPPSFAIDTVEELRRSHPGRKFVYLVGADHLPRLRTWRRFVDLEKLVEFVIFDRSCMTADSPYRSIRRSIDISSSEIRKRVAEGRSIRYLVPPVVEEIIQRHHLYQDSHRSLPKN